jgi:Leucine-rich repeat (LRR) protein
VERIEPGAFSTSENPTKVKRMSMLFNNISTIEDGAFDGLKNLNFIKIVNSQVSSIGEGAFRDLEKVDTLQLYHNSLTSFPKNVFKSMSALNDINLDHNSLTVINGDIFYHNTKMFSIDFSFNPIIAISENFLDGLYQVKKIDVISTACINQFFSSRETAMRGLTKCFDNYKKLTEEK